MAKVLPSWGAVRAPFKISIVLFLLLWLQSVDVTAQTRTSYWQGGTSSNWNTASNWSDNRVPDANTRVVIGGSNYNHGTVTYIPILQGSNAVTIYSLTITSEGAMRFPVRLDIRNLALLVTVRTDVTLIGTGAINNLGSDLIVGGNWTNNGSYSESIHPVSTTHYYPSIVFTGINKNVGGESANEFTSVTIAAEAAITLKSDLTINPIGNALSILDVAGTLDPELNKVSFTATPVDGFLVQATGTLKVKASTFAGNYGLWPTMYGNATQSSTVEYAANGNQTVANSAYGILRISGSGVKSLAGNTSISAIVASTQLIVDAGSLNLGSYTLNRTGGTVTGGTLTVANNASLRIGGSGTFPTGFATRDLGSTSTVEYNGGAQTVTNEAYGNLILSGSGTKTLPTATMTIAGKLASAGSASFTARGAINVSGDLELDGTSTFNGGSFTHTVGGNWINNATFTGNASTVVLNGANKQIRRAATASGGAAFHNLTVTGSGLTIPASAVTVSGNLLTSGAGTLTHSHSNGLLTMNGTNSSITGSNIKLNNFTSDGSITTASNIEITGNINVNAGKSFTASNGTIWLSGTNRSITSPGTLIFAGLRVTGTINTASSFTINGDLSGTGTITATANTVTFNGNSTYGGRHNFFNVLVASGKSLTMAADANLAVAGSLTTTGTLNVIANTPNTVTYNGTAAQTVLGREYHNIEFTNGGGKTANGALKVNGNLTINSSSNFSAGAFTHLVNRNWTNSGTFTHQNGTIALVGTTISAIAGATTFNALTINKSTDDNIVTQSAHITAATLNMTRGILNTGANTITITGNRTGTGWVLGTVRRQHTIAANTLYAFNSPFTQVSFATVSDVSEVSSTLTMGAINNFPSGAALNRRVTIAVPAGTYTGGTVRIQYLDVELNGNVENDLQLYRNASGTWESEGKTDNSSSDNWVSKNGLASVTGQWAISAITTIYSWRGSTSSNWHLASNWYNVTTGSTAASVPGETDIVELGRHEPVHQPIVNSDASIKGLQFISTFPTSLTLGTGNLTVSGNLSTSGNGSISNHSISLGSRTLHVGGHLILNHGVASNSLNLNLGSGTAIVAGDLNQAGSAVINLGSGNLRLSGDYNMSANVSNFNRGTGTFTYEGPRSQLIGEVYYNNLTVDKSAGIARLSAAQTGYVAGNITIKQGELSVPGGSYDFQGNILQEGGVFSVGTSNITVRKNWTSTGGVFNGEASKVTFTGNETQTIPAVTFNNIVIDKGASSVIRPSGNVKVNADLEIKSGILQLEDFTINRSAAGGKFIMGSAAVFELNRSNFPADFNNMLLDKSSTVIYKGAESQHIAGVRYGNLVLRNGGSTPKSLIGATYVQGDLTIDNGATLNGAGQTLTLQGDFNQAGSFSAGPNHAEGTLVLASNGGTPKSLVGNFVLNNWLLEEGALYTMVNGDITVKGGFTNQGSIDAVNRSTFFEGDFLNTGTLKSSGHTVFVGNRLQNIQLQAPLQGSVPHPSVPTATIPPSVEFAGSVAPLFNSTAAPAFGQLTISNTDPEGIRASVGWTVNLDFTIGAGAIFNGGSYTHNFHKDIKNNGTIISAGMLNFEPRNTGSGVTAELNLGATAESFRSTGTLQVAGSQKVALLGAVPNTLYRLVLTNTHTDGVSMAALTGNEIQVYDDLVIGEGATMHGGSKNYILHGNLTNNGIVQAEGSDVTFTSAKEIQSQDEVPAVFSGTGTATFKNFTVAQDANLILSQEIVNVYGNFAHNGASFDGSQAELKFKGMAPAFITAAGGQEVNIQHVHITKENGATVTLQTPLSGVTSFMVEKGIFDAGDQVISTTESSEETNSPLFQVRADATYKLSSSKMPAYKVHEFAPTSTIEYYGTNQTIESVQYGNLKLLNAGHKTFETGIAKIAGQVTLAVGVTVKAPETIEYNGAGNQSVVPIDYNNLLLSTGGVKTLAPGTIGIAQSLTLDGASIAASGTGVTVNYNGNAPQSVLPTEYYNLMLSNGSIKRFSGTTGIAAAFSLLEGATADLISENTIVFNGNRTQQIPGLDYYNLTSAGAGIKTLTGDASVVKNLTLTAGEIKTGSNGITLAEQGRISETKDAYVTGVVLTQRDLTTTREDFGGIGLTITPSSGAPGLTKVFRTTGKAVGANDNSILRNFRVLPANFGTNLNATVEMAYFEHELNGLSEEMLSFYTSNDGSNWKLRTEPHTKSDNLVRMTGEQSLQQLYTLGSTISPLPVELMYFNAARSGPDAMLTWATASEQDSKGFAVEVSTDGYRFRQLGFVNSGNGNSVLTQKYSYKDTENGKVGIRYYRLRQVDTNGDEKLYSPKFVNFGFVENISVTAYPNPFSTSLTLSISTPTAGMARFNIYDTVGKLLVTGEQHLQVGSVLIPLAVDSLTQTGMYVITIELNGTVHRLKVLKR